MYQTRLPVQRHAPGTAVDHGEPWQSAAACAGEDVTTGVDPFHTRESERLTEGTWDLARSICAGCPVIDACLAETLVLDRQYGAQGFRAGVAPEERTRKAWQATYR